MGRCFAVWAFAVICISAVVLSAVSCDALWQDQGDYSSYRLTTKVYGQGTVSPDNGTYDMDERVTLTARPAFGWRLVRWDGNASGTNNTTKVTMNMNRTVWAVFEPGAILALKVQVQGQGSTDPDNVSYYDNGTMANVRANPADGWHFLRWEGDLQSNDSVIQLAIDKDKTVTAVFEEDASEYTLNVEPGTGNVTAYPQNDTYPAGTVVSLIAEPLVQGEHFLRWEAGASGNVNAIQIIMDRNKTVEAVFEAEDEFYEFLVTIQGNGAIDYTFFTYQQNRVLDVRALPAPAWLDI